MKLQTKLIIFSVVFLMLQAVATAEPDAPEISETYNAVEIQPRTSNFDPLTYTLGPDDAIEISVMRHPEFSGTYPVNQEGKIQYKFVGDMEVNGLTKAELEQRIRDVLSTYVKNPEVNVTVTEYRSKYFYVLGEVGTPGKYYMRSETMSVREAVFEAGLPTTAAAMRKCRLISPSFRGNGKVKSVDLYSILYGGNLKKNINMHPGDVLYVPSTVMAKIIRVVNPVTTTVGLAASAPDSASTGRTATETLRGKPY
jgi:polysaccharide export outer membrane protein